MKCAMVYADGCRQIMLTPENGVEKQALNAMRTDSGECIEVVMRQGTFDDDISPAHYHVSRCQGGFFRRFADHESLMIEITESETDA